jgi:hypothetical protein
MTLAKRNSQKNCGVGVIKAIYVQNSGNNHNQDAESGIFPYGGMG